MICPNCGKKNIKNAALCAYCGEPIDPDLRDRDFVAEEEAEQDSNDEIYTPDEQDDPDFYDEASDGEKESETDDTHTFYTAEELDTALSGIFPDSEETNRKKSKAVTWLIILSVILALALCGLVLWIVKDNLGKDNNNGQDSLTVYQAGTDESAAASVTSQSASTATTAVSDSALQTDETPASQTTESTQSTLTQATQTKKSTSNPQSTGASSDLILDSGIEVPNTVYAVRSTCYINAGGNVNMRKGPGTNYDVINVIEDGEQVTVCGSSGEWRLIQYNEKYAWVHSDYVSDVKP